MAAQRHLESESLMENSLWSVLIPVLITGLFNVVLFRLQVRKEKDKSSAEVRKVEAEAGKILGETWEQLVDDLRQELRRQREEREKKEIEFIAKVEQLQSEIDTNAQYFQDLLEKQRALHLGIVNELREELDQMHNENKLLKQDNVSLRNLVNAQTDKIQLLQDAKEALQSDIKKLKKDTGALKKNGKEG